MALPDILDPMYWLGADGVFGSAVLPGILVIVFIETGLLFPLLPGESLLFTGGLLAAHPAPTGEHLGAGALRRRGGGAGRSNRVFHRAPDRAGAVQKGRLPVLQKALRDRVARVLREVRALGDHPGPVHAVRANVRPGDRRGVIHALSGVPGVRHRRRYRLGRRRDASPATSWAACRSSTRTWRRSSWPSCSSRCCRR